MLPDWARAFRDHDARWQRLSQEGVRTFTALVMEQKLPFAFETVFSHWEKRPDGTYLSSKIEEIRNMQAAGYFVVLLFVGLVSAKLSFFRVQTRVKTGGHDVPRAKVFTRFPRTQAAIGAASAIADMTLMFDNSREGKDAFSLVRTQRGSKILFDCRDTNFYVDRDLRSVAGIWMKEVVGGYRSEPSVAVGSKPRTRRQRHK
jgi:predicted ABC-type ATPase